MSHTYNQDGEKRLSYRFGCKVSGKLLNLLQGPCTSEYEEKNALTSDGDDALLRFKIQDVYCSKHKKMCTEHFTDYRLYY